ncbi:HlyD family efflux transporter periplasmic adaptor subunit [Agrobacterium tumefaciens]|uniref:HlyD family efflux transporter periplasmic adaptor subunit n=1 Tax=Agrobacterium tumefaciens TaxID=358 RepID=UPI0015747AA5|nr:HlyD family efflux transporter periplasmic adaptor subunit [Agrobacterium tumefaciens]NTD85811.1 HlyD family efflux transporter periplasmic adaptor subunit [Agrobacterium tumefaciens]NTD91635.1 HlyD family efflux transporter periplasmic adaptor subunit [Agrobacterium tumefaciens]NTE00132.1 HlyD family efflux transporter periplasmic adaptor subunit [Agrobacterium tumefaciens]NTE15277.1 HlyD family efflux transporter periplasmic adaptor subunit [Agrobacterium tumefaciens]NTE21072.1 HlyD famil
MAAFSERDFSRHGGWAFGDDDGRNLTRSTRVVQLFVALLVAMLVWAYFATLDEVSTGDGRVIPTSREQVIQSLEGGIVATLHVREDQVVEPGQILAQLDPTRSESDVEESAAKYRATLAAAARLEAEVNGTPLTFPAALNAYPGLTGSETELYTARRQALEESLRWIEESLSLVASELKLNEELRSIGAASNVEVIRLRRQIVELELKKVEIKSEYLVKAREELTKANAEVNSLSPVVTGRADSLARLTHRSPVRGIVKNIEVSTIGGVVPPNGKLMDIIPLGDELLIEARISPRDIAYIHPGQRASVKISAYDYAVYGSLDGKVTTISPDTIQDEVDREIYYYRVFIKTEKDALVNAAGREFPIVPGMVANVDIHTGEKTVLEYLVKPFNKAREALRER